MPRHLLDFLHANDASHHEGMSGEETRSDPDIVHIESSIHHSSRRIGGGAAAFLATSDVPLQRGRATAHQVATTDQHHDFLACSRRCRRSALTSRQAASFLEAGLAGATPSESSASSFLSLKEKLTGIVQSTPPAALVPLHSLAVIGGVPGHEAFELVEGGMFGFKQGFALALTGKFLGSAAAFAIGRSALNCENMSDFIKTKLDQWPLAKKVAKGVSKGGGASVFVIRMAPVPIIIQNYSLAVLTDIPYTKYLLCSLAGLVPTTAAHVYAGTLAPSAVAMATGSSQMTTLQTVALASPVVAGALLAMVSGYFLHQHVINDDDDETSKERTKVPVDFNTILKSIVHH